MNKLPENTWPSREFCNRWSGRLVVDGKYVKVKGYDKKIPFIYGIDYLSHDIPVGVLAPKNHYSKRQAWLTGIYYRYGKHDKIVQAILVDVQQRYDNFFAFNSQYREQC